MLVLSVSYSELVSGTSGLSTQSRGYTTIGKKWEACSAVSSFMCGTSSEALVFLTEQADVVVKL
jgi:hypothetical protein